MSRPLVPNADRASSPIYSLYPFCIISASFYLGTVCPLELHYLTPKWAARTGLVLDGRIRTASPRSDWSFSKLMVTPDWVMLGTSNMDLWTFYLGLFKKFYCIFYAFVLSMNVQITPIPTKSQKFDLYCNHVVCLTYSTTSPRQISFWDNKV